MEFFSTINNQLCWMSNTTRNYTIVTDEWGWNLPVIDTFYQGWEVSMISKGDVITDDSAKNALEFFFKRIEENKKEANTIINSENVVEF